MRRITKVGYQVRDFIEFRLATIRSGGSPEPFLDLGQLRVLMASLVEVGLVAEEDWRLDAVPLDFRGSHIDAMFPGVMVVVESRIVSLALGFDPVDQKLLLHFVPSIAALVVEMAVVVMSRERLLASLASACHRRAKVTDRKRHDPEDLVARSMLHADPEGFVKDAMDRIRFAREDVARGKRRILYVAAERAGATEVKGKGRRAMSLARSESEGIARSERVVPAVASLDTPRSLASVSAIRGITDDLLRPVEPVVRPSPNLARRRR